MDRLLHDPTDYCKSLPTAACPAWSAWRRSLTAPAPRPTLFGWRDACFRPAGPPSGRSGGWTATTSTRRTMRAASSRGASTISCRVRAGSARACWWTRCRSCSREARSCSGVSPCTTNGTGRPAGADQLRQGHFPHSGRGAGNRGKAAGGDGEARRPRTVPCRGVEPFPGVDRGPARAHRAAGGRSGGRIRQAGPRSATGN